ncbi:molybdopterin-converting factor, partial [Gorgonomyces haynaldii]
MDFDQKTITTVLITAVGTLGLVQLYRQYSRHRTIKSIKTEMQAPDLDDFEFTDSKEQEHLMNEQLSRNIAFLGQAGVKKLQESFVIVVGLGGVGSHAAQMLIRSGVGHIRMIDFDQVTLSSLNRHAVANRSDVGTPKVVAMKKHMLAVNPHLKVDAIVQMFEKTRAPELLSGNPDFVLDCIDNLQTKVDLIHYCKTNSIQIISSMGAGAKSDASRIQIADIASTSEDPLARSTRIKLKSLGVHSNVPVVYSTEKPGEVSLLPLDESAVEEADQYAVLPTFRARVLPVLGTLPALFGNAMASYVITELAGFKTAPIAIKHSRKTHEKIYKKLYHAEGEIRLNVDDVAFIFEEVWGSKSALSGASIENLVLTKWDKRKEAYFGNLICLSKSEADKHAKINPESLESMYDQQFIQYVQNAFKREQHYLKWR